LNDPTITPASQRIEGVRVKKLPVIADERGRLTIFMRSDDNLFERFGQVYTSTAFPGVIKAWHFHRKQVDHLCALCGKIRLVLYDCRNEKLGFGHQGEASMTSGLINEFIMTPENPLLVKIPAMVLHGIQNIGEKESMILNVTNIAYQNDNPDVFRLTFDDKVIPWKWPKTNQKLNT